MGENARERVRGERKDVSGEEEIAVVAQDLSNIWPEKTKNLKI